MDDSQCHWHEIGIPSLRLDHLLERWQGNVQRLLLFSSGNTRKWCLKKWNCTRILNFPGRTWVLFLSVLRFRQE